VPVHGNNVSAPQWSRHGDRELLIR
jgi:hypothetical protein